MRDFFKKLGKGIRRLGKRVGKGFKKAFKKVGGFFAKLGPIGTMAMMIIAPYILGPMMAGMSAATGLGPTSGTVMGQAGAGAIQATEAIASAQGISGAVAKTMFSVGKTLGTVGKTVTGALEGTLNLLGGGSATGFQLGSSIAEGVQWVANAAKTVLDAPGKMLEEVLPGDTSWLSAKRDELLGDPLFTTSGEVRTQMTPTSASVEPLDLDTKIVESPLRQQAQVQYDALGRDPQGYARDYSASIEGAVDLYPSTPTLPKDFTSLSVEDLSRVQVPRISGAGVRTPQPSLLAQIANMPGEAFNWAAKIPENLVQNPIATTMDLKAKATLARQAKNFFDPPAIPKPYGGYGGPGTALALDQLALSNLDYANMRPEQISQEDTVFTGLLSNDQAYDSALMDVLGKNMMYGLYTT